MYPLALDRPQSSKPTTPRFHAPSVAPWRRSMRQRVTPLLLACVVHISNVKACRRRVYMDLGANWANTLRLHHKLKGHVRQKTLYPSDPMAFDNCSYEWEVYAFEASPVMHPFIESFVKHLNGKGPPPPIVVPPVGGSIQMLAYAKHFGCPSRHNRTSGRRSLDEGFIFEGTLFSPAAVTRVSLGPRPSKTRRWSSLPAKSSRAGRKKDEANLI